jgi:hypothetical protein
MVDLFFDQAMTGNYELRFLDSVYPCINSPLNTNKLTCFGPRIDSDLEVTLALWDLSLNKVVSSMDAKTPDCSVEFIQEDCQKYNENECNQHGDKCYWESSLFPSGAPMEVCKNK